ncbi:OmpP1/FadL family transporter [Desulfurispira natronophila]|nr:outer membrane protein transport protein [Desulfurispira natronophila]
MYHYNNIILGERPMGMAGAYTAVADTPAGLYYNPAGIVYAHSPNLSASVNAFQLTSTIYENALGDNDWERQSSDLLPNFFGVSQPLGNLSLGFSYAVPDSVREDQIQSFTFAPGSAHEHIDYYTINIDHSNVINKIGPSVALSVNDQLSVGFTFYVHMRNSKTIQNHVVSVQHPELSNTSEIELTNDYQRIEEYGFEPVLGIMWSPLNSVSFGASIRQTTVINSNTIRQLTCQGTERGKQDIINQLQEYLDNDLITQEQFNQEIEWHEQYNCSFGFDGMQHTRPRESNERHQYPITTRLGAAWFPNDRLMLSGDLVLYDDVNSTWNAAVGGEYYLSPQWAVRGGWYTNNANSPNEIDYDGIAFSLVRFTRNSSVSAGFNFAFGEGKAQLYRGSEETVSTTSYSTTIFLGTSYSY